MIIAKLGMENVGKTCKFQQFFVIKCDSDGQKRAARPDEVPESGGNHPPILVDTLQIEIHADDQ